jgi:hypothetical protein
MTAKMSFQPVGVGFLSVLAMILVVLGGLGGEPSRARVKVTIQDEKPVVVEAVLPVDPTPTG